MIVQGEVPTITVEELEEILEECGLEVRKTRNLAVNLGWRPEMVLGVALNRLILEKAETEDDDG